MFNLKVKSRIEKSNANERDSTWVKNTKFAETSVFANRSKPLWADDCAGN
jgi:hypothetical protein